MVVCISTSLPWEATGNAEGGTMTPLLAVTSCNRV
jgi:hypothetical protein